MIVLLWDHEIELSHVPLIRALLKVGVFKALVFKEIFHTFLDPIRDILFSFGLDSSCILEVIVSGNCHWIVELDWLDVGVIRVVDATRPWEEKVSWETEISLKGEA